MNKNRSTQFFLMGLLMILWGGASANPARLGPLVEENVFRFLRLSTQGEVSEMAMREASQKVSQYLSPRLSQIPRAQMISEIENALSPKSLSSILRQADDFSEREILARVLHETEAPFHLA